MLNKLTPLMKRTTEKEKKGWIIMVSSMEGQFYRNKTTHHPHTNSAKAALNMLVRTSAPYYEREYKILMNSVDTGWVTDEYPVSYFPDRESNPPIDEIDGASRILDPIFQSIINNKDEYGLFYKDYSPTEW